MLESRGTSYALARRATELCRTRMLFEGPYLASAATFPFYDVSPDGERFLMLKPVESQASPNQIQVVLNWFEELKQKSQ